MIPFQGIIGHEAIVEVLRRQVSAGCLAHAYLFVGPEGVGRSTVAREFITTMRGTGLSGSAGDPTYSVARLADEKTGKLKSAVSVEQIRELRDRLLLTSFSGERKAAFIEDADWMNEAAANALLKTLEEPRGDTTIVLRAETVESVPATIASRCQVLRFHPVADRTIADALVGRGLDREEASRVAGLSSGRPGVAIRLVTDGAYRAERETAAGSFETMMSSSLARRLALVADLMPKAEADKATALGKILDAWEEAARLRLLAGDGRCVRILDRLRESREAMERNISPQLALEHVVL
jgi:DNA polymerase-3 subunit delta'